MLQNTSGRALVEVVPVSSHRLYALVRDDDDQQDQKNDDDDDDDPAGVDLGWEDDERCVCLIQLCLS